MKGTVIMKRHSLLKILTITALFYFLPICQINLFGQGADEIVQQNEMSREKQRVEHLIAGWDEKARLLAGRLLEKYGNPDEATAGRLIWHNSGEWNLTELTNDEIPHNFPIPHNDILYQEINYPVPVEKFDDLARYDGSLIIERTRGTIGSRCDSEEANILAINLAVEVMEGKKDVNEARETFARALVGHEYPELVKEFAFSLSSPRGLTGDPDRQFMPDDLLKRYFDRKDDDEEPDHD